jgi:uncharacterized surface protein with fasciclin (FAS1) repeats
MTKLILTNLSIPTNAAFSQSNQTTPSLSSHIIPSILYLPSLKDGATYTTQGGGSVTIRVRGNDYFVNNARIVASNQILNNGVAHVVDQVRILVTGLCLELLDPE